jgi:hypothetical protein
VTNPVVRNEDPRKTFDVGDMLALQIEFVEEALGELNWQLVFVAKAPGNECQVKTVGRAENAYRPTEICLSIL